MTVFFCNIYNGNKDHKIKSPPQAAHMTRAAGLETWLKAKWVFSAPGTNLRAQTYLVLPHITTQPQRSGF